MSDWPIPAPLAYLWFAIMTPLVAVIVLGWLLLRLEERCDGLSA